MRETRARWTNTEIDTLFELKNNLDLDWDEIGNRMNRTPAGVRVKYNRINKERQYSNNNKKWTEKDIKLLKELVGNNVSISKISKFLQRKPTAIKSQIYSKILSNTRVDVKSFSKVETSNRSLIEKEYEPIRQLSISVEKIIKLNSALIAENGNLIKENDRLKSYVNYILSRGKELL